MLQRVGGFVQLYPTGTAEESVGLLFMSHTLSHILDVPLHVEGLSANG